MRVRDQLVTAAEIRGVTLSLTVESFEVHVASLELSFVVPFKHQGVDRRFIVEHAHSVGSALHLSRTISSFAPRAIAGAAIFDYIEIWYNRKRRHSTLGYVSPEQYESSLPIAA